MTPAPPEDNHVDIPDCIPVAFWKYQSRSDRETPCVNLAGRREGPPFLPLGLFWWPLDAMEGSSWVSAVVATGVRLAEHDTLPPM